MKKLTLIILLLMFIASFNMHAQTIEPVKKEIGRLIISIDPRIEALSAIQAISSYPLIKRKGDYYDKVYNHFNSYSDLTAVSLTSKLYKEHGFGFDRPVTFMLYLSQPKELEKIADYKGNFIGKKGEEEILNHYRESIKEFIDKSNFEKFWNNNIELYNKIIECTIEDSYKVDWIKALEDYYNQSQNSYNIILNPLNIGGYGPSMEADNGELNLYNICTTDTISEDGIPYLGKDNFAPFAWHEFSHSFVAPLIDQYVDEVNKSSHLLEPLREVMRKQAYETWEICVEEHIVRAVVIRLYSLYLGEEMTKKQLQYEEDKNFIYIEPLIEKLKEYESLKKSSDITFAEFFPELIEVFENR